MVHEKYLSKKGEFVKFLEENPKFEYIPPKYVHMLFGKYSYQTIRRWMEELNCEYYKKKSK